VKKFSLLQAPHPRAAHPLPCEARKRERVSPRKKATIRIVAFFLFHNHCRSHRPRMGGSDEQTRSAVSYFHPPLSPPLKGGGCVNHLHQSRCTSSAKKFVALYLCRPPCSTHLRVSPISFFSITHAIQNMDYRLRGNDMEGDDTHHRLHPSRHKKLPLSPYTDVRRSR
jgi:hypothetical protein